MQGETLDRRLQSAARQVRMGSRLADIGTDHALLPFALVRSGVCPYAVASDIRTGPAERARRAVEEAQLADRIEVRLGPGLSVLQPEEADDLVIAGMGGETIVSILGEAPWIRSAHFRLILQPMSRPEVLRRWLHRAGFLLEAEPAVEDGGHLYSILRAHYEPEAVPAAEEGPLTPEGFSVMDFRGAIQGDTLEGRAYLRHQQDRLLRRAQGLREARDSRKVLEARQLEAVACALFR